VQFDIIMVMSIKKHTAFWYVWLCSWVESYRCFRWHCYLISLC